MVDFASLFILLFRHSTKPKDHELQADLIIYTYKAYLDHLVAEASSHSGTFAKALEDSEKSLEKLKEPEELIGFVNLLLLKHLTKEQVEQSVKLAMTNSLKDLFNLMLKNSFISEFELRKFDEEHKVHLEMLAKTKKIKGFTDARDALQEILN